MALSHRRGSVGAAVLDAATGHTYVLNADLPVYTASIIKVAILASLLREAQLQQKDLTARDRALAERMIVESDNDATTTLWREQGGAEGLVRLFQLAGLTATVPAPTLLEPWDGVRTTARDQLTLLRELFTSHQIIDAADARYELSLMSRVDPAQRWGITAGATSTWEIALKNGWVPVSSQGWTINSEGIVDTGRGGYVLAVVSEGSPTMRYGIQSVEMVARKVASVFAVQDAITPVNG